MRNVSGFILLCVSLFLLALSSPECAAQFYWVNGGGSWDDPSHWSKTSGKVTPAGRIPTAGDAVIIDDNAGFRTGAKLTVPPGTFAVGSIEVTTSRPPDWELSFSGAVGNQAALVIDGNLILSSNMSITYANPSGFANVWQFVGSGTHRIETAGHDLNRVEFRDNGTFVQGDDLLAAQQIRMHGGTWQSKDHEIRTDLIQFRDDNSSSNPIPKLFEAGTSEIHVGEWNSRFAYQSLVVTGEHVIYTPQFFGSPSGLFQSFSFNEIHLFELPEDLYDDIFLVETNNFDCADCSISTLVIEGSRKTKLASGFTVTDRFEVVHPGAEILFNAGNQRSRVVGMEGSIVTPDVVGCSGRTRFSNAHADAITWTRSSGSLVVADAELNNIIAQGGASFALSNSILLGGSTGWTVATPPKRLEYRWIGNAGSAPGDWDKPGNWALTSGASTGCLPTFADDVVVDNAATSDLRIPAGFTAQCRNFVWTNPKDIALSLDGANFDIARLNVAGDFQLYSRPRVEGFDGHDITLSANGQTEIFAEGVDLPKVRFESAGGDWSLASDFKCSELLFSEGALSTHGHTVQAGSWISAGSTAKRYAFGASTIRVNGLFELAEFPTNNVTLDAGSSHIVTESILAAGLELHDLTLENAAPVVLTNFTLAADRLFLAGSEPLRASADLTLAELVFAADGASLEMSPTAELTVTESISSLSSAANPGRLLSRTTGTSLTLDKPEGNLCISGPVALQDVAFVGGGIGHAPQGIDDGNNSGIAFDDASASNTLYWVGGSGAWAPATNWSGRTGGCSDGRSPDAMANLVIDDNGLFRENEQIDIPANTVIQSLTLTATDTHVAFQIADETEASSLTLSNSYLELRGGRFEVIQGTNVDGSVLISNLSEGFTTGALTNAAGLVIVRPGSTATVKTSTP